MLVWQTDCSDMNDWLKGGQTWYESKTGTGTVSVDNNTMKLSITNASGQTQAMRVFKTHIPNQPIGMPLHATYKGKFRVHRRYDVLAKWWNIWQYKTVLPGEFSSKDNVDFVLNLVNVNDVAGNPMTLRVENHHATRPTGQTWPVLYNTNVIIEPLVWYDLEVELLRDLTNGIFKLKINGELVVNHVGKTRFVANDRLEWSLNNYTSFIVGDGMIPGTAHVWYDNCSIHTPDTDNAELENKINELSIRVDMLQDKINLLPDQVINQIINKLS